MNLEKRHKTLSKIRIFSKMKKKPITDLRITLTTRPRGPIHRHLGKSTRDRNKKEKRMSLATKPWNNGK
jgi:hypothetical protein